MDRMLVVVFDNESKAYEGEQALNQLNGEGSIAIYAETVLTKNGDGTTTMKQESDQGPLGTLGGTAFGSLIGLLGGPAGFVVGASAGALAGSVADLDNARVGADFIDDVRKQLSPGRVAVIAEIDEDWTTPVDTRMEALGGKVFRRALADVRDTSNSEEVAAMKADLAQMKAEHAKAQADRKGKLIEKINQLDSKIQNFIQKDKERTDAFKLEAKAKAEALKAKVRAKAS